MQLGGTVRFLEPLGALEVFGGRYSASAKGRARDGFRRTLMARCGQTPEGA